MFSTALIVVVAWCPLEAGSGERADRPVAGVESDLDKALAAWLKAYRRGKLAVTGTADIGKSSIAKKYGVLPAGLLGRLTVRRELSVLLELAARQNDATAAELVLQFAAAGMDDIKYTDAMAPHVVREAGESALTKFTSDEAKAIVFEIARDGNRASKGLGDAMQAAAIRGVAALDPSSIRELASTGLTHGNRFVRIAAADALGARASADSISALASAIRRETDGAAMLTLVGAVRAIHEKHAKTLSQPRLEAAVDAAVAGLRRSSWRADIELIAFLEDSRAKAAVPALIEILELFVKRRQDVKSGELSGMLRFRAQEALISLTGAYQPIDEPGRWREWWEQVQTEFAVAADRSEGRSSDQTSSGFFGIPVRGSRVVFIVDVSLSMSAPMHVDTSDPSKIPDEIPNRLDAAKAEVWRAVQGMGPDDQFNLITFSKGAAKWQKQLTAATPSNKKKFKRYLDKVEPLPYTDLWSGLTAGMKIRTGAAAHDDQIVDEIFVLSDGAPTIGDVTDEQEILRLVTETNRFANIAINSVFIVSRGSTMDPALDKKGKLSPEELMKRLAEQNGGRFVRK